MKISDVLGKKGREVHTIDAGEPVSAAVARFGQSKIRCLVVTEGRQLAGILTIRDALLHLDRRGAEGLGEAVREAMTADVVTVAPESGLDEAHECFTGRDITHLPVLAGDELLGLVTRADVLASRVYDVEESNTRMLEYISGSYL